MDYPKLYVLHQTPYDRRGGSPVAATPHLMIAELLHRRHPDTRIVEIAWAGDDEALVWENR